MSKTVFWSWQSDLDARVTRDVIRYALDESIKILAASLEEAHRPNLTSDTQGVSGTPDIVATILRKIDEAAVFVGDVTPIAVSESDKACANPNVLLEMGYANKALTEHRVIQVWNTAFEGATIEKLPFDMRGRRGPMSFHLPSNAEKGTLREVRTKLASQLADALKLAFDQLPPPPKDVVHWQPHHQGDAVLWFDRDVPQTVTNPKHGSSKLRWKQHWPGYARIIPSNWTAKAGAKEALADQPGYPALLASANSLSYGASRGGTMVYWPGTLEGGANSTIAITQWFKETGELWGVAGGFLFKPEGGRLTLATGYFFNRWLQFIERNCTLALAHGGSLPIHIRLGVSDLTDSWWPQNQFDFGDGFAAVEDTYEFAATLTTNTQEDIKAVVVDAFNGLAAVYGVEPQTLEQIEAQARF